MLAQDVEAVGAQFEISGRLVDFAPLGSGHIHDTFVARYQVGDRLDRFVFQRLNTRVFPDPEALMDNWVRICDHLRSAIERDAVPDPDRRCPRVLRARDGRPWCIDSEGAWWRSFPFIEGSRSVDTLEHTGQAFEAARAFGDFLGRIQDLPAPPPAVTIEHFHDLPRRFAALERAVSDDTAGRRARLERDIERAQAWYDRLEAQLASVAGSLPTRIVHNDCKLNNVLLDDTTGEGLCVIDLDTVMAGTVLSDFGELIRTSSSRSPEDEIHLDEMSLELDWLRALTRGFLSGTATLLSEAELAALPLAGPLMAYENGIRFLTDHLEGDIYFRVHREGHNLDRFRAQLRLVELLHDSAGDVAEGVAAAKLESPDGA